ncbi:hypothetical protein [Geotoga petraea]|nr:hypothetical protein [Geotoga petraea]
MILDGESRLDVGREKAKSLKHPASFTDTPLMVILEGISFLNPFELT